MAEICLTGVKSVWGPPGGSRGGPIAWLFQLLEFTCIPVAPSSIFKAYDFKDTYDYI